MHSRILIDPRYRWKKITRGSYTFWYIGNERSIESLTKLFGDRPGGDRDLAKDLSRIRGNFAAIVEGVSSK